MGLWMGNQIKLKKEFNAMINPWRKYYPIAPDCSGPIHAQAAPIHARYR